MFKKKVAKAESSPVGGMVFYASLLFLLILGSINLRGVVELVPHCPLIVYLSFLGGSILGIVLATFMITGRTSVFLHEFKHSVVSGLAGNRAKSFRVRRSQGHFEYQYTKDTAAYNAFIALAPYYFPLFSIVTIPVVAVLLSAQHLYAVALAGIAIGIDLTLNKRDVSPHQSDFSCIRGGFTVGVLYVLAAHFVWLGIALAWVLGDTTGLRLLFLNLWKVLVMLVVGWD